MSPTALWGQLDPGLFEVLIERGDGVGVASVASQVRTSATA